MSTIAELMSPELRTQLSSGEKFVESLNEALEPYGIKYGKEQMGKSLSKIVKESAAYQALPENKRTDFFNKIKSIFKAHHVGERLAVEAVARGFWARFNNTTVYTKGKNIGEIKTIGVTFVNPDEKASKEDGNIKAEQDKLVLTAENKRLQQRILELEADGTVTRSKE
jgi:hypothetical protein